MKRDLYFKIGTLFLGTAVFAIGFIHLITGNFPTRFIPIALSFPSKPILAYLCGIALMIAGAIIPVKKFTKAGAIISTCILLIILILVHIPALAANINNGGEWTFIFELFSILGGHIILLGIVWQDERQFSKGRVFFIVGQYIFAAGLCVFGIVHLIYEKYIITWIPLWLPNPVFWTYLVPAGFFCAFVSLVIQKKALWSSLLLALMFFIFAITVNLPRAIRLNIEEEWTGIFVALAMSGISLLIAAAVINKSPQKSLAN